MTVPLEGLELWAGAECSMVRVGDRYVDQVELTGHDMRLDDIDMMAAAGARAVRLPILWERTWPDPAAEPDWHFADTRLHRLRELDIRPIVGLVHHGSGPPGTSLLEESFVTGLERFAAAVAARYPWVSDYTPVNEPLTTARFSGLYGHWYPHGADDASFLRALEVQCRGIRAAMTAIRQHAPGARLVQTEDLGTTFSTPRLAYQATFDNRRRLLSLDLLAGRIDHDHPLAGWLVDRGLGEQALASFREAPCPPDLIGINHYVTSDRFLDHRVQAYPPQVRGGNGRHAYADVEAVRVLGGGLPGHQDLLEQVWRRYRVPVAITEVHLGCSPEEQARWLAEAWQGAQAARQAGADVRAVTVWAAFGSTDWDSLLTEPRGHYEPGMFDVRGGRRRPTAVAQVAGELAANGLTRHPLADEPGWWRRSGRLAYPAHGVLTTTCRATTRPVLVTGGRGTLGHAVARICGKRGLPVVVLTRQQLDIGDPRAVAAALDAYGPWAVVNAAGYVRVDDAEAARGDCFRINSDAVLVLAAACEARGIRLAAFSSDLVFDGSKGEPYVESDAVAPLGIYGESKARIERELLAQCPTAVIARTSAFFGPWDEANFLHAALASLQGGQDFHAADDTIVSPTYVPDLADATLTLLVDGASGIWHLANPGATSWHDFARQAADMAGITTRRLLACPSSALQLRAPRPSYSALGSERGALMPPLADALQRFLDEVPPCLQTACGRHRA